MNQPDLLTDTKQMEVKVLGETLTQLPEDLYIPPDALRIFLVMIYCSYVFFVCVYKYSSHTNE